MGGSSQRVAVGSAEGNIVCHKPLKELGGNLCVEGGLLDEFRSTTKVGLKDRGSGEKVLPRVSKNLAETT